MRRPTCGLSLLVLSAFFLAQSDCEPPAGPPAPVPFAGAPEYMAPGLVPLPLGAVANALGGNLYLARTDLVLRTQLGSIALGRSYNSASGWTFGLLGMRYTPPASAMQAGSFRDATGAVYGISWPGPIPGTNFVVLDSTRIKTKQGLVFTFTNGALASISWLNQPYPDLQFSASAIQQCTSATSCSTIATITQGPSGPTAISDTTGRSVVYAYTNGVLTNAKTPMELQNGLAGERYGYGGGLATITTSEGVSLALSYTLDGRITQAQQAATGLPTSTWSFGYTQPMSGMTTSVRDPLGGMSSYVWDYAYHVISFTSAAGDVPLQTQ